MAISLPSKNKTNTFHFIITHLMSQYNRNKVNNFQSLCKFYFFKRDMHGEYFAFC